MWVWCIERTEDYDYFHRGIAVSNIHCYVLRLNTNARVLRYHGCSSSFTSPSVRNLAHCPLRRRRATATCRSSLVDFLRCQSSTALPKGDKADSSLAAAVPNLESIRDPKCQSQKIGSG